MKKQKEDMLQTLSFLSLRMENSGSKLINAIVPGVLVSLDPALMRENHRYSEPEPEFSELEIKEVLKRVKMVASHFGITLEQTLLFSAAFNQQLQDNSFDWSDMRRFFDVKSMAMLPLKKEFDRLVKERYFIPSRSRRSSEYDLNPSLMEVIMEGKAFKKSDLMDANYDRYKFVREVSDLIESRSNDEFKTRVLFEKTDFLEQQMKT